MKDFVKSPWFNVTLGIIGLVIGYTVVIAQQESVFAASQSCPAQHICQGESCDKKPECADGRCSEDCKGNCPAHS